MKKTPGKAAEMVWFYTGSAEKKTKIPHEFE